MNCLLRFVCVCAVAVISTISTQAQQVITDSTFHYQFVLPGGFKQDKTSKHAKNQTLYIDDNGSSLVIQFDPTKESESDIIKQLEPNALGESLSSVIPDFEKVWIKSATVNGTQAANLRYNCVYTKNGERLPLAMMTRMYYWKGHIVNIACTAARSIFDAYQEQFNLVLNSFTHDLDKELVTEYYDNNTLFLSTNALSLKFPDAPTKSVSDGLVTYQIVDEKTDLNYSLIVSTDNNFIGLNGAGADYMNTWLKSYKESLLEDKISGVDTTINGYPGISYAQNVKDVKDTRYVGNVIIIGNTALIVGITGRTSLVNDALKTLVASIKKTSN